MVSRELNTGLFACYSSITYIILFRTMIERTKNQLRLFGNRSGKGNQTTNFIFPVSWSTIRSGWPSPLHFTTRFHSSTCYKTIFSSVSDTLWYYNIHFYSRNTKYKLHYLCPPCNKIILFSTIPLIDCGWIIFKLA